MKYLFATTALIFAASTAGAATLDFEGLAAGYDADANGLSAGGVDIAVETTTNPGGVPGTALVFDTDNPTGNDDDLAAPFSLATGGPADFFPGKVLIISEENGTADDPNDNGGGGTITFTFSTLVNVLGFDVFDDVSGFTVTANTGDTSGPINIAGDNEYLSITGLDWTGVSSLTFDFANASGAIDNISFTPIPVPASLPLIVAGLGALAIARRRTA